MTDQQLSPRDHVTYELEDPRIQPIPGQVEFYQTSDNELVAYTEHNTDAHIHARDNAIVDLEATR